MEAIKHGPTAKSITEQPIILIQLMDCIPILIFNQSQVVEIIQQNIRQNVSDGVAYGNYTAHCSSSGWADPSFTTATFHHLRMQTNIR